MAKLISKTSFSLEDGSKVIDRKIQFADGVVITMREKPSWYLEKPEGNPEMTKQQAYNYYCQALEAGVLR